MAAGPSLILSIRKGKEETRLVDVAMPDGIVDSQLSSVVGLCILRMYNTLARDGGQVRAKTIETIRKWHDR